MFIRQERLFRLRLLLIESDNNHNNNNNNQTSPSASSTNSGAVVGLEISYPSAYEVTFI